MKNNMPKLTLEPGEGRVPHRVFDLSIVDIDERRAKSILQPSAADCMNFLGVSPSTFYRNRTVGTRITSKKLDNKVFAVRVESTTTPQPTSSPNSISPK